MKQAGREVSKYISWQIQRISLNSNESAVRADLAKLRRGIGKKPGALPELWPYTLEGLAEKHLSRTGKATRAEWAIYTALTLFALHQQGLPIKEQCMSQEKYTLAEALVGLIKEKDDLKRIKRRFDAAITSQDMEELAHHTRGLVQQLRSAKIPLNYPRFAEDLYWYQIPTARDGVRLNWGREFYREYDRKFSAKQEEQKEKKE